MLFKLKKNIMNNLIIDTAGEKIFLKSYLINKEYNIKHDNSRENFDELVNFSFLIFLNKIIKFIKN